ncbi:hypothetical protein JX265_013552 [Neoarthrinium moseri]|uniref:Uncharacterized protein n=1 Tax=Neoarthrinium moseri TaxID=1658444 RepID=A0A9P9W876_9PEZI|nr:uncharacterized protein JN550_005202 [Neoarthrinium moseri]KAI1847267.1 hypothetical protein JX266_006807 [Neoarthrinium moseri]KAI1849849.1 hypothetical protein JX265_013552 [Neoarthrinium moseri]KAI1870659.1 hypothetical protein JN550_005202 [Neoarthrinium moseri]
MAQDVAKQLRDEYHTLSDAWESFFHKYSEESVSSPLSTRHLLELEELEREVEWAVTRFGQYVVVENEMVRNAAREQLAAIDRFLRPRLEADRRLISLAISRSSDSSSDYLVRSL